MERDNKISDRHYREMNAIASALDETLNESGAKKVCFVLLVTEFNQMAGRVNYISNGRREDIVVMLKEVLARFEGQPEQSGTA